MTASFGTVRKSGEGGGGGKRTRNRHVAGPLGTIRVPASTPECHGRRQARASRPGAPPPPLGVGRGRTRVGGSVFSERTRKVRVRSAMAWNAEEMREYGFGPVDMKQRSAALSQGTDLSRALDRRHELVAFDASAPQGGAEWARHHGDDAGICSLLVLRRVGPPARLGGHAEQEELALGGDLRDVVPPGRDHPPEFLPGGGDPLVAPHPSQRHLPPARQAPAVSPHEDSPFVAHVEPELLVKALQQEEVPGPDPVGTVLANPRSRRR